MTIPELLGIIGGLVSFLAMMIVGLAGVVYRNDREVYKTDKTALETRVVALEKQNIEQETRIATITAQLSFAREGNDRLVATLDKLDDRLESMTRGFSELRSEVQNLARRLPTGYTPGTMPAVRK